MAREDLVTKNDVKYLINLAIEHVEKECCPYTTVLELLGGIKKDIDELKPAEALTPCERDGHNFIITSSVDSGKIAFCTKCGEIRQINEPFRKDF